MTYDKWGEAKAGVTVGAAAVVMQYGNEIITILTILFLVAQILLLIPKYLDWYRAWRQRRKSAKELSPGDDEASGC